jgi:hypothetical protein
MSAIQLRGRVVWFDASAPRIGGRFESGEVIHALLRVGYGD